MLLIALGCFSSCLSPAVEAQKLLGSNIVAIRTSYYHDFSGVSTHGELFDFQECRLDTLHLKPLLKTTGFQHSPDYSEYERFYKKKLSVLASSTWKKTPVDSTAYSQAQQVFQYGNLQDDVHSRLAMQKNYLREPGNYFAYYLAYPVGTLLYILVPGEGKLFIFRNRG